MARDTEHGRAITAQITRRHGTLEEAIEAGIFALGAAGLSKGIRRQARGACEDYFYNRLGLTPSSELGGREDFVAGLELMPDPMYRALEDIVELVVDGDYEELHAVSRSRLAIEDLRRRLEDDFPESLVLPSARCVQGRGDHQVRRPAAARAGPTSSTSGLRPARRTCTSRARSRSRASASR